MIIERKAFVYKYFVLFIVVNILSTKSVGAFGIFEHILDYFDLDDYWDSSEEVQTVNVHCKDCVLNVDCKNCSIKNSTTDGADHRPDLATISQFLTSQTSNTPQIPPHILSSVQTSGKTSNTPGLTTIPRTSKAFSTSNSPQTTTTTSSSSSFPTENNNSPPQTTATLPSSTSPNENLVTSDKVETESSMLSESKSSPLNQESTTLNGTTS